MFNSLKPKKWLGKDKTKAEPTFQNTQEIIAFIHKTAAENPDAFMSTSFEWDCCVTEEYLEDSWVKERKDWSDAAYRGDWDGLFKIAAKKPDSMGRLANVTRLLPTGGSIAHSHPSGYTVLHQVCCDQSIGRQMCLISKPGSYHNAPEEIAKALVTLGCFRQLHSTDGKSQRPADVARERGFISLAAVLEPPPDLLPNISPAALEKIQEHFATVVKTEAKRAFKPDSMRIADLGLLREVEGIWMPVPGMYGGFKLSFEEGRLISESWCRVVDGSGMRYHITADGAVLVDEGFV